MAIAQEFITLPLGELRATAHRMKDEGYRFIQTHAVYNEPDVDLYYSFMKDGVTRNYRVAGVTKDQAVPSITDLFLAAFVFENEARELFGVDMRDIAIDFAGNMYAPAEFEPMTIITPEQKAAREKAKKAADAKAAKEASADGADASAATSEAPAKSGFVMTPERQARLDAKMATMSPEKKAKVEAALARIAAAPAAESVGETAPEKAAETADAAPEPAAEAAKDVALEEKLANMDAEKAAKVRAALAGKAEDAPAAQAAETPAIAEPVASADAQLEALIGLMDESKASVVRAALNQKGGE